MKSICVKIVPPVFVVAVFCLLALNGCDKFSGESNNAAKLVLDCSSVVTSAEGEEKQLYITCNSSWKITGGAEWVSCSQISGTSSAIVSFSTSPNTTFEERRATYTIVCGEAKLPFIVIQKQRDALTVSTNKIELPMSGCDFNVEVKANITYEYEICDDCKEWISPINNTRSLNSTMLMFHAEPSEEISSRVGTIIIRSGKISEYIKVYQSGGHTLVLTTTDYKVLSEGKTINIELRSNVNYSVKMPDEDWIVPVETRSASTHSLQYIVKPNDTYDSRSAEIVFLDEDCCISQTVTITQFQLDAILLAKEQYDFDDEGGEFTAELASNVEYSITSSVDWITPIESSETRALTTASYRFVVAANPQRSLREGWIVVKGHRMGSSGFIEQSIKVRQQGVPDAAYQIHYTTTDGKPINYNNPSVVASNVCENGEGVITFLKPVKDVDGFGFYTPKFAYQTLKTVTIPEGANRICDWAFGYCQALESVSIPASVETIDDFAFAGCKALKTVDIPDNSAMKVIGDGAFHSCESLEHIFIPDAVTTLKNTFGYCSSLKSLTFGPNSQLRDIGIVAFSSCESLQSLHFQFLEVPEISSSAFGGCGNLIIYVPETMIDAYVSKYPYLPVLPDNYLTTKYVSTDYSSDGRVETVQIHTQGNGIKLVLMGNGYSDVHQIRGTYDKVMNNVMEGFFSVEPYTSLRPYFDVYFVRTVSKHETLADGNSTVFNRRLGDYKVFEYARKVPGFDPTKSVIGVVENFAGTINGAAGVCNLYEDNSAIAYFRTMYNDGQFLTYHELCGHAFGKLDEEYIIREGYTIQEAGIKLVKKKHSMGWYENVDVTNDPSNILWADFLKDPLYSATVGIYEGAGGCAYGVYRPSKGSFMGRGDIGDEGFNPPSRYSIWKKAMTIAGESCSWDKFVEFDAPARNAPTTQAKSKEHLYNTPTVSPVFKNCSWTEAK